MQIEATPIKVEDDNMEAHHFSPKDLDNLEEIVKIKSRLMKLSNNFIKNKKPSQGVIKASTAISN